MKREQTEPTAFPDELPFSVGDKTRWGAPAWCPEHKRFCERPIGPHRESAARLSHDRGADAYASLSRTAMDRYGDECGGYRLIAAFEDPEAVAVLRRALSVPAPTLPALDALKPYAGSDYDQVADEDHRAVWDAVQEALRDAV